MIIRKMKMVAIIAAILAITVSTILNAFYRQSLYQMGANFIYDYQSDHQDQAITIIQNIISIFGNTAFIVPFLLLIHIVVYRKLNSIVYIMYIVINTYFISLSKQAFQDPRPFYSDDQIEALEWTCPRSYGFPSGHSWVAILLYEPVISDLIGTKGWKKIILGIVVLLGVLMPISRQYLGSHTADQVTSGILYSIAALILYKYWLQEQMYKLAANAMKGRKLKLIVIITTVFFFISIAVPFAIYSININNRQFNPSYLTLLNIKCLKNYSQKDLQKDAGTAASIIGLFFGCIYGFAIVGKQSVQRSFMIKVHGHKVNGYLNYMRGYWHFENSCCNGLKFILLYILFGGFTVGMMAFGMPLIFTSFYLTYLLQTVGYCLFGIFITSAIPYLLIIKLQVIMIDERCREVFTTNDEKSANRLNQRLNGN